ncbi:hypothetical protein G9A89_003382 [Geosiphon pyriformis]|nr:hypothetical protein G9A89_003382 [Geosiphon pyriformis]
MSMVKFAVDPKLPVLNVLDSEKFSDVHGSLLEIWLDCIKVYTDGFLKSTGFAEMASGMAAYFLVMDMDIEVKVFRLLFSTLAELQAVALALECVLFFCTVVFYLNNQSAINAYVSEVLFVVLDFCSQYWIKKLHITNLIKNKNILVK